jgi:tRNA(Ile)-lysidine synthase TilS/MesJ
MRLEAKDEVEVDLAHRFRQEARELPQRVALHGNAMQDEIARTLLARHAPHIEITPEGEPVALMSLERYASAFLASLLEGTSAPSGRQLLRTIPERTLVAYARRHAIPVVEEERDAARGMLERIAQRQPQTFFSLARSAQRILAQQDVSAPSARARPTRGSGRTPRA